MKKRHPKLLKWAKVLPVLALYQTLGCLPDNALSQVVGENVVYTATLVIQSITSIVFNGLLGVA